ncbi:MAG: caspase family protein [Fibrobacterales bacterium]
MRKNKLSRLFITSITILFVMAILPVHASTHYGLFIGHNQGDPSDAKLKYSEKDAEKISSIFSHFGFLQPKNITLLKSPTKKEVITAFNQMQSTIALHNKSTSEPAVFIFYFSGHGDSHRMKLGSTSFTYHQFARLFKEIPARVKIGFFDACESGSLIRKKGVKKVAPVAINQSITAEGTILISSSAHNELSHESDQLGSSYFTHYFTNGLRGAADVSGDNKVSLMEAYTYAYHNTLIQSQSFFGTSQHPNAEFNMKLEGDLILTDLNRSGSGIILDSHLMGSITIANRDNLIVADLTKRSRIPLSIALNPGNYTLYQKNEETTRSHSFVVRRREQKEIYSTDLHTLPISIAYYKGTVQKTAPIKPPHSYITVTLAKALSLDGSVKSSIKVYPVPLWYLAQDLQFNQSEERQYWTKIGLGFTSPRIFNQKGAISLGSYYCFGLVGKHQGTYIYSQDFEIVSELHLYITQKIAITATAGYALFSKTFSDTQPTLYIHKRNTFHIALTYNF